MDLMYMSEAFTHMDFRHYSYDAPERSSTSTWTWSPDDLSVSEKRRSANREKQRRQRNNAQPCILCLESKRRKLGNYIRQKSVEDGSILEEEEEEAVHTLHQHVHSSGVEQGSPKLT